MTEIEDGGNAFPRRAVGDGGMTLRAYLAGQALPGLIVGYATAYGSITEIAEISKEAVNFADEIILLLAIDAEKAGA